jgi:hypothetical protein
VLRQQRPQPSQMLSHSARVISCLNKLVAPALCLRLFFIPEMLHNYLEHCSVAVAAPANAMLR